MKSAVRRILLMSALMSPNALFALGLGEIHLNSALNQPFDADIDLVSAADEDLSALRASLASGDTFTRYGLDKPAYLADFTLPRRSRRERPGRAQGHVAQAGHRALRDAAGRGELAARAPAARIHRAARSARLRSGRPGCRRRRLPRQSRRRPVAAAPVPASGTAEPFAAAPPPAAQPRPRDVGPTVGIVRGGPVHQRRLDLSRAPERHAVEDRECGVPRDRAPT